MLKFILFADDTTIFLSNKNYNALIETINKELVIVNELLKVNKLSLNITKTHYIIFKNNVPLSKTSPIHINNVEIE